MFANRFTALVDACVLTGTLKRNLILSLAAAEFFRVRWSSQIMDETEAATLGIRLQQDRKVSDAETEARHARSAMERASADAIVSDYDNLIMAPDLPDPADLHIIAAAVKTRAAVIITDNIRHFPATILPRFTLSARTADGFIADTIDLDLPKALLVIEEMRLRFRKPELSPEALLLWMEAIGLTATADLLRPSLLARP